MLQRIFDSYRTYRHTKQNVNRVADEIIEIYRMQLAGEEISHFLRIGLINDLEYVHKNSRYIKTTKIIQLGKLLNQWNQKQALALIARQGDETWNHALPMQG